MTTEQQLDAANHEIALLTSGFHAAARWMDEDREKLTSELATLRTELEWHVEEYKHLTSELADAQQKIEKLTAELATPRRDAERLYALAQSCEVHFSASEQRAIGMLHKDIKLVRAAILAELADKLILSNPRTP